MHNTIKQYFKHNKLITKKGVIKFFKLYPEFKTILETFLKENPNWESIQNIITGIIKNIELPFCKTCGKQLKYYHILHNRHFCSSKCAASNKEEIKKRQNTCLTKYGVKAAFNKENAKLASQKTLKKFKKQIQLKKEKTSLKNNNCKYHSLLEGFKNILKCKKYVIPLFSFDEYQGYNKVYTWKCSICGNIFKSNIHGSRHASVDGFSSIPRCLKCFPFKTYYDTILSWKDYIIPLFNKSQYIDKHQFYQWQCVKCGNIFNSRIYKTNHIKKYPFLPRCFKCYPLINTGYSNIEEEFVLFCKQYFPNLSTNNKKLIYPLELDIVIDELKLAFEFNGIYWHSTKKKKPGYHLNKTELCEAKGYRLIHIWEDEWENNKEYLKQKIIDIFENKEIIDYSKPLDRCWYQYKEIPGYTIHIEKPILITKKRFTIENCGYLIYKLS